MELVGKLQMIKTNNAISHPVILPNSIFQGNKRCLIIKEIKVLKVKQTS